jgi:hypothetical protein
MSTHRRNIRPAPPQPLALSLALHARPLTTIAPSPPPPRPPRAPLPPRPQGPHKTTAPSTVAPPRNRVPVLLTFSLKLSRQLVRAAVAHRTMSVASSDAASPPQPTARLAVAAEALLLTPSSLHSGGARSEAVTEDWRRVDRPGCDGHAPPEGHHLARYHVGRLAREGVVRLLPLEDGGSAHLFLRGRRRALPNGKTVPDGGWYWRCD